MSIFVFIFGLIVGSFANVLVYRLPRGQGVVKGRSRCPRCRKKLWWGDLIPVLSFIWLRGQCRYCHKPISWRYPMVELISGLLFLLPWLYLASGGTGAVVFYIFLLENLLVLALIDMSFLLLLDKVILFGLAGTLFYGVLEVAGLIPGGLNIISWSHLLSALFFLALLGSLWFLSKGQWIGLGDAKLMGWLGLVLGWPGALITLYMAIVIGGIISLGLYLSKKAGLKTKLPLGTFICLAAGIYIFLGSTIINYLNFYLIFNIFK